MGGNERIFVPSACLRLAARIADLKRQGVRIKVETVRGTNKFGDKTAYAKYTLIEEENNA